MIKKQAVMGEGNAPHINQFGSVKNQAWMRRELERLISLRPASFGDAREQLELKIADAEDRLFQLDAPRNGAEVISETLSDGSLVWNVALVIGEQTMILNMGSHYAAESLAEDFNNRVMRGHIVGA